MTPKRKYDERKRLRLERELHFERKAKEARDNEQFMEERMERLMNAFERIADAMELWADQQEQHDGTI